MGILEKLGLRKESTPNFSAWLGGRLQELFNDQSRETGQVDPRLLELGERIVRHVDAYGVNGLERAVDGWIAGHDGAHLMIMFYDVGWLDRGVAALEAAGNDARGCRQLLLTLRNLGVLSMKDLRPGDWHPEARTAVYQMLEAVWPFAKSDEALRERLLQLTGSDPNLIRWELLALRSWSLAVAVNGEFKENPAPGHDLIASVTKQVEGRAADVPGPADFEQWLGRRFEGYTAATKSIGTGAATILPLLTTAIGRQFARNFDSDNVELRYIGTEVFVTAIRMLTALARAHRQNR